eukprot:evm.model.scf_66EXC.6 EVM.evm.TU.scf_66EXC.6   scf_66EXC:67991-71510(+)
MAAPYLQRTSWRYMFPPSSRPHGCHAQAIGAIWTARVALRSLASDAHTPHCHNGNQAKGCDNETNLKQGAKPLRAFMLTLERSIGKRAGLDNELWATGLFDAGVVPDLPVDAHKGAVDKEDHPKEPQLQWLVGRGQGAHTQRGRIQSVAAQMRSESTLRSLLQSAQSGCSEDPPLTGILVVSGTGHLKSAAADQARHPSRDSFWLLKEARSMQEQGLLSSAVRICAVENPLVETSADRLARKVDCGAEVIFTQPPLAWQPFEHWLNDADKLGLLGTVQVVVGLPMVTSSQNFSFWSKLCEADGLAAVEETAAKLSCTGDAQPEAEADLFLKWNRDLISKVQSLNGIAGMHVMPLSREAHGMAMSMLADGSLKKPDM